MSLYECPDCASVCSPHQPGCPNSAVPMASPSVSKPTAYEQLMASLDERVKWLEAAYVELSQDTERRLDDTRRRQEAQDADLKAAFASIEHVKERLLAALRRIEQLEREVTALKGPKVLTLDPLPDEGT